jgi:hypothetical protein
MTNLPAQRRLHSLLVSLKLWCDKNPEAKNAKAMLTAKVRGYEALYGPFDGVASPDECRSINEDSGVAKQSF